MKIAFATLGCKVNHYETQSMLEQFQTAGWEVVGFSEQADVYCINTCSVTQISDKKSRQLISQAHRRNRAAFVVAVGCYAQMEPDTLLSLPGVGLVVGNAGKKDIVSLVESHLGDNKTDCVTEIGRERQFENLSAVADSRTRATLKIQDGCDNFCTYCVIPYVRGPVRSRTLPDIAAELKTLSEKGFSEVGLTGIHIASYGKDFHPGPGNRVDGSALLEVLRTADGIPGITRVRLGSLEPNVCSEEFVRYVAGMEHICHQFHLSLQSGSDPVLTRMGRRYTSREFRSAVEVLRKYMPDCAVTTDVIAGFVAETEEEHAETCRFMREIGFARTHVFPYSRRPGTAAARMEGHLEKRVREARAAELIAIGRESEERFIDSMLGTVQQVIVEKDGAGYTDNYGRVLCGGDEGEIKTVILTERKDLIAIGKEV